MSTALSTYFTLEEFTASETATSRGIDNTPDVGTVSSLTQIAHKMDKVREFLGHPIHVNSAYRCPALNAAVGSKPTSQHIRGEAVDFICGDFGTPLQIAKAITDHADYIDYDQLIMEHTWVHISFAISTGKPRKQVLSLLRNGGYASGLTDIDGEPYTDLGA